MRLNAFLLGVLSKYFLIKKEYAECVADPNAKCSSSNKCSSFTTQNNVYCPFNSSINTVKMLKNFKHISL